MTLNNAATAAKEEPCAETAKYLRDKSAFEAASAAGFAEAERIAAEYLAERTAKHGN